MGHNQSPRGKNLEIMDGMFFAWIEKHMVDFGSALHLDERPIVGLQTSTWLFSSLSL